MIATSYEPKTNKRYNSRWQWLELHMNQRQKKDTIADGNGSEQ